MSALVKSPFARSHSEILAALSRLTSLASASAEILEKVDEQDEDKWSDSLEEVADWIATAHILFEVVYGTMSRETLVGGGGHEIAKFLDGEDSELDELWDEI